MALQIQMTNEIGIISNYFRIANITQNFINAQYFLDVYIYGYASEDYRNEEKAIADNDVQMITFFKNYRLPIDDSKGYSRTEIYQRIKTEIPEFNGAVDV